MREQIKHFLQLKTLVIGAIGLKMLFAKAVIFQLLAAKAVLAEAAILAVVSAGPVFAQSATTPVIVATDTDGNLVTVQKGIDEALPPPIPKVKKLAVKSVSEKLQEHNIASDQPQGTVGKTFLAGKPMTAEEQVAYVKLLEEIKAQQEAERLANSKAVGQTSLAGVMTAEEEAEYKALQAELAELAAQKATANAQAIGKTFLGGVAE